VKFLGNVFLFRQKCILHFAFPKGFKELRRSNGAMHFSCAASAAHFFIIKKEGYFMFDNIGGKIKTLARVVCWIGIIGFIISGLITMCTNESMILPGILTAVIGSFLSWIGSFMVYGFGQLIENTDTLVAQNMRPSEPNITPAPPVAPVAPVTSAVKYVNYGPVPEGFWACKKCGTHNKKMYGQCKKCGTYRS